MKRTTPNHVIKVIDSCITRDQLMSAMTYVELSGYGNDHSVLEALRVKTFESYTNI